MKFVHSVHILGLATAAILFSTVAANATSVDFDNVTGSTYFQTATVADAAPFVDNGFSFTGGVVLAGAASYDDLQTSGANLYATGSPVAGAPPEVNNEIEGGTVPLPGFITGTLADPGEYSHISMSIINGNPYDSQEVLTAFNSSHVEVSSDTVSLEGFLTGGDTIDQVVDASVSGPGISYFTIVDTTVNTGYGPHDGNIDSTYTDFAIDTVEATPEANTLVAFAAGLILIAGLTLKGRRKTETAL